MTMVITAMKHYGNYCKTLIIVIVPSEYQCKKLFYDAIELDLIATV